jgi:hypothetical protein
MKIKALLVLACLGFPFTICAQAPVLVTATIVGTNSAPYISGTYQIQLVDANGNLIPSTGLPTSYNGGLTSVGALSVTINPNSAFVSGSQWKFTICSQTPNLNLPVTVQAQKCFSQAVTIAGAGDVSAALSEFAPAIYYFNPVTGTLYSTNSGVSLLPTANTWTLQQTFNQGILLSNNAPIQANNSSGIPGTLAYVDVSNNYYFGDIGSNLVGTGYWYHAGSPSLTFTAGAVTFNRPPVFASFILNGSQSVTGVQGSSSTNLMLANSGTFTPGDCLKVATDGSAQDFGAACGSGSGGVVTALTTTGSSGAATLGGGILNIPVYTGGGVADINLTVSALTIAGNGSYPQYPAAASTVSFPGLTTAMVPLCGFSGDPVITNGWGQVGGAIIRAWASAPDNMSYRIINQTNVSLTTNTTGLRCSAQ